MNPRPSDPETVRAWAEAYAAGDRAAADRLAADDFVFSSPRDDRIDRAAYFERCFPTAERLATQKILEVVPVPGGRVFILYEHVLKTGERYRNVELTTVRDGRLAETQVFFGGSYGA